MVAEEFNNLYRKWELQETYEFTMHLDSLEVYFSIIRHTEDTFTKTDITPSHKRSSESLNYADLVKFLLDDRISLREDLPFGNQPPICTCGQRFDRHFPDVVEFHADWCDWAIYMKGKRF